MVETTERGVVVEFVIFIRDLGFRSPPMVFFKTSSKDGLRFVMSVVLKKNASIIRPGIVQKNIIFSGV